MRFAVGVGASVAVAAAACSLLTDFGALEGSSADGSVAPSADASGGSSGSGSPDAGQLVEGGAGDAGLHCRGTKGPRPVQLDGYCIDSTEATADSYREFLAAVVAHPPDASAGCEWNTDYDPGLPLGTGNDPVIAPDWCDAKTYCEWAGKRLCGARGGGPPAEGLRSNAFADEWFAACSQGGKQDWPYGTKFDPNACIGYQNDAGYGPRPVPGSARCEGGYPGIFDLAGNLWEWEDGCGEGGADAPCTIRGGSYVSRNDLSCHVGSGTPRDRGGENDIGIRCCSDLEP